MLVWMTDARGFFTYLNPRAKSILPNSEQLHQSDWLQYIHRNDRISVRDKIAKARQACDEYQVEYQIVRSNGTIRWVLDSAAPRFDDHGVFMGYTGTLLDVTKRYDAFSALAKSEAEYRLLAQNTSDMICHCDQNGRYLYLSPSYAKVIGIETAGCSSYTAYDFIHPDDIEVVRGEILRQSSPEVESKVIEFRKRSGDGIYFWVGSKIKVIWDPITKNSTGSVTVCRDITRERQEREERYRSESRFRSLTHISSDWYWETDTEDRLTFVSEGIENAIGISPSALLGEPRGHYAVDKTHSTFTAYKKTVESRVAFKNLLFYGKNEVTKKDFIASISGEPFYDGGTFQGYRGVGRDITSEREILLRAETLAAENKALVQNSLDIISLLNENGTILQVNSAVKEILGYDSEELIGKNYTDFIHIDELPKAQHVLREIQGGKENTRNIETRYVRRDGGIAFLSSSVRRDESTGLMYSTARDVTEVCQARANLQLANEELNRILQSIGDAFFSMDNDWRIVYANQKATEFVGIEKNSSIGKRVFDIVPGFSNSSAFEYYKHAMRTRENTFFEVFYEPVGAWVEARIYPHEQGLSISFQDITEKRKAANVLRESEQRFREMISLTPAGYLSLDAEGFVQEVNPAFCGMTGYSAEELTGRSVMEFLPACPLGGGYRLKGGAVAAQEKEAVFRHKLGHSVYVLLNLTIKRDADGNPLNLTAFVNNISERKEIETRLEKIASHDILTGLPNRALLSRHLRDMQSSLSFGAIAVMFVDLDRFKEVNDSMGHSPGDKLLKQVAERLAACMRASDVVARLGGDEFIVSAQCSTGRECAAVMAERLLAALAAPFHIEGKKIFIGASIGISMYPEDANSEELLFQNADIAMYHAKTSGRNKYTFFEKGMNEKAKRRMLIEQSLRGALERQEFELYYQPRIELKSMAISGMEALIRWMHPKLGNVSPAEFIPIAEDTGLIAPIGRWVLEAACNHACRLMAVTGLRLSVSVNLSARQLQDPGVVEYVDITLKNSGLSPELLELELTETALIEDLDRSAHVLKRLKRLGILLSVDDFGTGYSGLSYLKRFPMDIVKLDRSFITQKPEGVTSQEFIKALVDMAHALKLSVVAEGIENADIVELVRNCLCDEGQGYHFAKPMSFQEMEEFIPNYLVKLDSI